MQITCRRVSQNIFPRNVVYFRKHFCFNKYATTCLRTLRQFLLIIKHWNTTETQTKNCSDRDPTLTIFYSSKVLYHFMQLTLHHVNPILHFSSEMALPPNFKSAKVEAILVVAMATVSLHNYALPIKEQISKTNFTRKFMTLYFWPDRTENDVVAFKN